MVTVETIAGIMERIAPRRYAENWDNPGLLVGSPDAEVRKIFVCLDVSTGVIREAVHEQADLIVSHHPLIFRGQKAVRTDEPVGRLIRLLLKHDIAAFAAHTNLDIAAGGVNDVLAERIGLTAVEPFVPVPGGEGLSMGRMGRLAAPTDLEDFAKQVKAALPVTAIRYVKADEHRIERVALCSGSGAEFIGQAAAMGADVYVTGDVKYHDVQLAKGLGLDVIDAGHFGTEFPVVPVLAKRLRAELAADGLDIPVIEDTESQDFFQTI